MLSSKLLLATCASLFTAAALVQDPTPDRWSLQAVAGDVGIIVNPNGGNVAVLRNDAGSLIVDSNFKRFRKEYTAAFKSFAGDSPRFMINTH